MNFEWVEIWNNSESDVRTPYWEATYRAEVFGGWLVKNEIFNDSRMIPVDEEDTEGWQNTRSNLIFIPDPKHEWEITHEE